MTDRMMTKGTRHLGNDDYLPQI